MGAFPIREQDTVATPADSSATTASETIRASIERAVTRGETTPSDTTATPPPALADGPPGATQVRTLTDKDARELSGPNVLNSFKAFEQGQLLDMTRNSVRNILNSVRGKREELELSMKRYNLHILSLHKKFALGLSCIILFFVGAPLGAIIRKGGLGLPMVVAIVLFLTYYFIGVFSGNYAKEGVIHPVLGAWLPTLIMLPLGIWLTLRATRDRGLMSFGHVTAAFREIFARFGRTKKVPA